MREEMTLDLARGRFRVADVELPVRLVAEGVQVDGVRLRPLTFGERSRVVRLSCAANDCGPSLAHAVLSLAADGAIPEAAHEAYAALALWLAGADRSDLPGFTETGLRVAQATGWRPDELAEHEATAVDALAAALEGPPDADGWIRLELSGAQAPTRAAADVVARLCDNLLRRGETPFDLMLPSDTAPTLQPAARAGRAAPLPTAHDQERARAPRQTLRRVPDDAHPQRPLAPVAVPPAARPTKGIRVRAALRHESRPDAPSADTPTLPASPASLTLVRESPAGRHEPLALVPRAARSAKPTAATSTHAAPTHVQRAAREPGFNHDEHPPARAAGPAASRFDAPTTAAPQNLRVARATEGPTDSFDADGTVPMADGPWCVADELAQLLDEECDLRGIPR